MSVTHECDTRHTWMRHTMNETCHKWMSHEWVHVNELHVQSPGWVGWVTNETWLSHEWDIYIYTYVYIRTYACTREYVANELHVNHWRMICVTRERVMPHAWIIYIYVCIDHTCAHTYIYMYWTHICTLSLFPLPCTQKYILRLVLTHTLTCQTQKISTHARF